MSRSKKNIVKRKNKRVNSRSKKNMMGGFAPDETQHLLDNGFQQHQIDELNALNVSIDTINEAIEYFNNNFNAHQIIFDIAKNLHNNLPPLTNIGIQGNKAETQPQPQPEAQVQEQSEANDVSQDSQNSGPLLNLSDLQAPEGAPDAIPQAADDNHNLDMNQSLDLSGDQSLDLSGDQNLDLSGVTSVADESMNTSMNSSLNSSNASMNAGRRMRRHTKKRASNLRRKRSHKRLKGGAMYGTGYGANCNDPNYSIYNTNLTKLFPYRPTTN